MTSVTEDACKNNTRSTICVSAFKGRPLKSKTLLAGLQFTNLASIIRGVGQVLKLFLCMTNRNLDRHLISYFNSIFIPFIDLPCLLPTHLLAEPSHKQYRALFQSQMQNYSMHPSLSLPLISKFLVFLASFWLLLVSPSSSMAFLFLKKEKRKKKKAFLNSLCF